MRIAFRGVLALTVSLGAAPVAFGQAGTASRIDLGTSIGAGLYREDTGWGNANFSNSQWAVDYGTTLNGGSPWTSVFQGNRSNASFTASTNLLTLDLNGFTYAVKPYSTGGPAIGGLFIVTDKNNANSSLRITNGTVDNTGSSSARTIVGNTGQTGRLTIDNATLKSVTVTVGNGSGAKGFLTIDSAGKVTATNVTVGTIGTGTVDLRGANAVIEGTTITIGDSGSSTGTGAVTVTNATALLHALASAGAGGDLIIENPNPSVAGNNIGLRVDAGSVIVDHDLKLSTLGTLRYGAVTLNGGTLTVGGTVSMGSSTTETNGGKIFLSGGRLEVASPGALAPSAQRQFYWNTGTLAFTSNNVSMSNTQLNNYTAQGATSYAGGRAAGTLVTGQRLDAAGTLTLTGGGVSLAGGTIKAGTGLVVNSPLSGNGTIDALVSGTGTLTQSGASPLAIGALGGANAVGGGNVQVGHLGVDSTHTGTVNLSGTLTKVGTGTQTFRGPVMATTGLNVNAGKVTMDGSSLVTSTVGVAAGATARVQGGAAGNTGLLTTNAATPTAAAARLEIDGASSRVTATSVANNGWISLTDHGTLTVGSVGSPGQLVNNGTLINGGTVNANVTGAGTIGGTGAFVGGVTVASGATLAPGNSPGTLSFTDLTLDSGGSFELEIANALGTAGIDWDLATVSNLLTVAATSTSPFTVAVKSLTTAFAPGALDGFDPTQSYTWKFLSVTDPSKLVGFDSSKLLLETSDFTSYNDLSGGTFSVVASNNEVDLTFTPHSVDVPEPGSAVLLGFAGLALIGVGWRRRAAADRRNDAGGPSD